MSWSLNLWAEAWTYELKLEPMSWSLNLWAEVWTYELKLEPMSWCLNLWSGDWTYELKFEPMSWSLNLWAEAWTYELELEPMSWSLNLWSTVLKESMITITPLMLSSCCIPEFETSKNKNTYWFDIKLEYVIHISRQTRQHCIKSPIIGKMCCTCRPNCWGC